MPRVTMYVPDDLKARMDAVGEAENWSAVAQRAFREAVALHSMRKDTNDMTSVVERLRASKERVEERDRAQGLEAGKKWAMEAAEYDDLVRAAEYDRNSLHEAVGLAQLRLVLDPDDTRHSREWVDFWHEEYGYTPGICPSDVWADAFIEGAAEVYSEVADQL